MSDDQMQISLDDWDTAGQRFSIRFTDEGDEDHIRTQLEKSPEKRVRVRLASPEDDTEGHAQARSAEVRLNLFDEDDTEGHAITVRFPSTVEADAFRKRLLAAGLITGAMVLGAAGAVLTSQSAGADRGATVQQPAGGIDEDTGRPARSGPQKYP